MNQLKELIWEVGVAIRARDGVRLGNAAHRLRCKHGYGYKSLVKLAAENGLDPAEYDELVRQWDDADQDWRLGEKSFSF